MVFGTNFNRWRRRGHRLCATIRWSRSIDICLIHKFFIDYWIYELWFQNNCLPCACNKIIINQAVHGVVKRIWYDIRGIRDIDKEWRTPPVGVEEDNGRAERLHAFGLRLSEHWGRMVHLWSDTLLLEDTGSRGDGQHLAKQFQSPQQVHCQYALRCFIP